MTVPSVLVPSLLWCCWLGGRKGIRSVKNWVVGRWRGYLSGARCRLVYGPADATSTHCLLLQKKTRLVLPFWYWLTRVVSDKEPLNRCVGLCACACARVCVCVCVWLDNRKPVKPAKHCADYSQRLPFITCGGRKPRLNTWPRFIWKMPFNVLLLCSAFSFQCV